MEYTQTDWTSQVAQWQRRRLPLQETRVPSLDGKDPLEEEMAAHSSILTWRIPRMEEPGGLHSIGLQRVRHDWVTEHTLYTDCDPKSVAAGKLRPW